MIECERLVFKNRYDAGAKIMIPYYVDHKLEGTLDQRDLGDWET